MGIKNSIWVILFISVSAIAQTDTINNAYHKEFRNKLAVQVFSLNTSNSFTLNYQEENTTIEVTPNQKTTLGLAVQYGIISFSLGFAPKLFAENKDNKGSRMTSFSFDMFPGKFMLHFDLYSQKGVTIQEQGGNSVYLEGFKTLKIGGNTAYFFNKNFSYSASALQNTKQLKSAGSFAPTLYYYYTEFNAKDEPLIESENDKSSFVYASVAPAYYYNWVIGNNFLVSSGVSLGGGIAITPEEEKTSSLLISGSLMLAAGYNAERWYGGFNTNVRFFDHSEESNVQVNDAIAYASVFIGYRFDEPAFLKRKREKIEEKLKQL